MNKLQIRSEVLMILKNIHSLTFQNHELLGSIVESLEKIEDKETLCEVMLREILKSTSQTQDMLIFLLFGSVDKEIVENKLWKMLKSSSFGDEDKYVIINILKDIGSPLSYDSLGEYVQSTEDLLDYETKKLLETAKQNPEAQIDFLDFVFSINEKDQNILIDSLINDFEGEALANILIPVILSNPTTPVSVKAIDVLAETNSPNALNTLLWVIKNVKKEEVVLHAKKSVNILKLKGIRQQISRCDFYKNLLELTVPSPAFVSVPDGNGNFGLIFVRAYKNKNVQIFAVVININLGIIDCFGFNEISEDELGRILSKFYQNEHKILVCPEVAKKILDNAEEKSYEKQGKIPYEYASWKVLTEDIKEDKRTLKEIFEEPLKKVEITLKNLKNIYEAYFFGTWFFEYGDNKNFDELLSQIDDENIESIEKRIEVYKKSIFDEAEEEKLNKKMLLTAYFMKLLDLKNIPNVLYSLIFDEELKSELQTTIIKKSIYEYYLFQRENIKRTAEEINIFKAKRKYNPDIEKVNEMIEKIETAWAK